MFPHRNIYKYNWTSPDAKTNNQIDYEYILADDRRHSNVPHVPSFRVADCDNNHYLAAAKDRERLAVNKQRSHRSYVERFDLKTLNELGGKEQYSVEVSNRFAALEDLHTEMEISSA
jgi:hypothetical protein